MPKKFLRRGWSRYSKLGRKRKKKQVWRNPTGRDNKMREKRKGYPDVVKVGYKQKDKERGKINGKTPVTVYNIKDLKNIKENQIVLIGRVGLKRKKEIAEKMEEKGIKSANLNIKKFLKDLEKKERKPKEKVEESNKKIKGEKNESK